MAARKAKVTTVIVTQRPSVLQYVDKVMLLQNGMVKDFGPKDEVMNSGNVKAVAGPKATPKQKAMGLKAGSTSPAQAAAAKARAAAAKADADNGAAGKTNKRGDSTEQKDADNTKKPSGQKVALRKAVKEARAQSQSDSPGSMASSKKKEA